eukprot:100802_1
MANSTSLNRDEQLNGTTENVESLEKIQNDLALSSNAEYIEEVINGATYTWIHYKPCYKSTAVQYKDLTDVKGVESGTDRIYYYKHTTRRSASINSISNRFKTTSKCWQNVIDVNNLDGSHILLGTLDTKNDLDNMWDIFNHWSPCGEANQLIESKGLTHTSMSVGDIIVNRQGVFLVDDRGFFQLKPWKRCNVCGKKKDTKVNILLYRCGKCKEKLYCSRKCQKIGWSRREHRLDCVLKRH